MGYCCDQPDHVVLGKKLWKWLELWVRKAIECSELGGKLYGSLNDRNVRAMQMAEA